jgi:hypothetical protein
MTRLKLKGLVFVAVFALSALGAASASAAPEWFQGGERLEPATKIPFTGAAGVSVLEARGGLFTVTCTKDTSKGDIDGPLKETKVTVTYTGCRKAAKKCTSAGQAAGVIVTSEVVGHNIYLDSAAKGHTKAGILFAPKTGTAFAVFTCEGELSNEVPGEVIGEAAPLGGPESNTSTLTFAQEHGEQEWLEIEEAGAEHSLNGAGLGGGAKLTDKLVETVTYASGTKVELHKT